MNDTPKLGQLITGEARRDAIHIAVAPVMVAEGLYAGDRVKVEDGIAYQADDDAVGIIDPFLRSRRLLQKGERYWVLLFPNTITSLRHEWVHPAFDTVPPTPAEQADAVSVSWRWITEFARELDQTVNRLMDAANLWVECGDYTYDNSETYKNVDYDKWADFWKHYAVVTRTPEAARTDSFFTCSC